MSKPLAEPSRSSRSGSETRKRKPIVGFRASEEEQGIIEAAADRAGLTVSSYVRSRALAKPTTRAVRRPPLATAQLAQLLGMLGAAGSALQSLTAKDPNAASEAAAVLADVRTAASAILQTLGKRAHDH